MNGFDLEILHALRFSGEADSAFGILIQVVSTNYIFKGVFVAVLFWGLWLQRQADTRSRSQLVSVAAIGVIAIALGRLLAATMPFRVRPRFEPSLQYVAVPGDVGTRLETWSSMPSDHAVMYFALATGLFLINRKVGTIALMHALFVISLPRVGLWLHYPSDILIGAAIGIVVARLMFRTLTRLVEKTGTVPAFERHPAFMYPMMFLATFQIASNFESLRTLLSEVARMFGHL